MKNKTILYIIFFIVLSQTIIAQTTTTVNGVTFTYIQSAFSSIDYSVKASASNCGISPSAWVGAIKYGPGALTITVPNPVIKITFLVGALDATNSETITLNGMTPAAAFSNATLTSTNTASGCIVQSSTYTVSPTISGSNGVVVISSSTPFTSATFAVTGPYQVISVLSWVSTTSAGCNAGNTAPGIQ